MFKLPKFLENVNDSANRKTRSARAFQMVFLLLALTILISSFQTADAQQQPSRIIIGAVCAKYRYATQAEAAANAVPDCQQAVADNDCGMAGWPNPFIFTNAYSSTGHSKFKLPYFVVCQGYFGQQSPSVPLSPPPPQPVSVMIGEHCVKYRYDSQANANQNDQKDCQAAVNDDDCGIESVTVPTGSQFILTNEYPHQDTKYALSWLDVCQGYIGPQKYPPCVTGHTVAVSSASDCPGQCAVCGNIYCPPGGGYCSGGSERACQGQGSGSKLYCDCGTTLECNCTGPNCGALSPKRGPLSPRQ
jgi:hypothetical protein